MVGVGEGEEAARRRQVVPAAVTGQSEDLVVDPGGDTVPTSTTKAARRICAEKTGRDTRMLPATVESWIASIGPEMGQVPSSSASRRGSPSALHVNLEYVVDEVSSALRPGGLFAVQDYIGEARAQYSAARLERANEVLQLVPQRFRRADEVAIPSPEEVSPFEAIRADEILDLVKPRFDVVHIAESDALHPLFMLVDFEKIEREEPALLTTLFAAEEEARRDPAIRKCSVYGVFRKRPSS